MKMLTLFLIVISSFTFAQDLQFYGKFEPGNMVIVKGSGIQYAFLNSTELDVADNTTFLFGFDRDEAGEFILKIKFESGKVLLKKFELPGRKYRIQRINNMKKSLVTAPDTEQERIKREREISRTARKTIGDVKTAMFEPGIQRPVNGGYISSVFGSQRILNGVPKNAHNGLDIAAPRGTPVYAMTDGVVKLAADTFYYSGNNILIDHGLGLNSFYLHLSKMDVSAGDTVKKGQKIGEIGTTGRSTGPHLHWGVQWYGKRVDPAEILKLDY